MTGTTNNAIIKYNNETMESKMRDHIKSFKVNETTELQIIQDDDASSPREWDNLGTMVCFHGRYNLGDKDHGIDANDYANWDEMREALVKKRNAAVVLPLYVYEHSGLTMSCDNREYPYNDRWDACQVGFIFIDKEKVRREYSVKRISKKLLERIAAYLGGEVMTYDQWLRGDVYGYQIVEDGEVTDSCWGFYGTDFKENGVLDCLPNNERQTVEAQL